MTITAKIIADSVWHTRITTLQLRYPRLIHAEFMTHRAFSRNASSSRAIPVERLIQDILDDTAMPIHWGKNQKGMQAREEHDALLVFPVLGGQGWKSAGPDEGWLEARDRAIDMARRYARAGYHKQVVNRLLEPFAHINVVVTATDWANFFELRLHPDAQPEIHELARVMKEAMDASEPLKTPFHFPYLEHDYYSQAGFRSAWHLFDASTISAARCARVSYLTHEGKPTTYDQDIELGNQLRADQHMSPFEHQAIETFGRFSNFTHWRSYRHYLENL